VYIVNSKANCSSKAYDESLSREEIFCKKIFNNLINTVTSNTGDNLRDPVLYHFGNPGKMFRTRIFFKLSKIFNFEAANIQNLAVATELLHEASLVHDDISDSDTERRGQKTLWSQFDQPTAILVGDYLMMLSQKVLLKESPEIRSLFLDAAFKLAEGQQFESRILEVTDQLYFFKYKKCASLKTGALFELISDLFTFKNGLEAHLQLHLHKVFCNLGILFQIRDDLIDLYGGKGRLEMGCDIKEGRASALVALHLDHFPEDKVIIDHILLKPRDKTAKEDVNLLKSMFESKGTVLLLSTYMRDLIDESNLSLRNLDNSNLSYFVDDFFNDLFKTLDKAFLQTRLDQNLKSESASNE
jgi:geranylgeranyl pyrophosphate synthase